MRPQRKPPFGRNRVEYGSRLGTSSKEWTLPPPTDSTPSFSLIREAVAEDNHKMEEEANEQVIIEAASEKKSVAFNFDTKNTIQIQKQQPHITTVKDSLDKLKQLNIPQDMQMDDCIDDDIENSVNTDKNLPALHVGLNAELTQTCLKNPPISPAVGHRPNQKSTSATGMESHDKITTRDGIESVSKHGPRETGVARLGDKVYNNNNYNNNKNSADVNSDHSFVNSSTSKVPVVPPGFSPQKQPINSQQQQQTKTNRQIDSSRYGQGNVSNVSQISPPENTHPPPLKGTLFQNQGHSIFDDEATALYPPQKRSFSAAIERPMGRPQPFDSGTGIADSSHCPPGHSATVSISSDSQSSKSRSTASTSSSGNHANATAVSGSFLFPQPNTNSQHEVAAFSFLNIDAGGSTFSSVTPQTTTAAAQSTSAPPRMHVKRNAQPKAELHILFSKAPRRKIISSENYHTWHDSGQAHSLKWTSAFIDPVTGEIFLSGSYPAAEASRNPNSTLLWYIKKQNAEHAAAARAMDCLTFRDLLNGDAGSTGTEQIGLDDPYVEKDAIYKLSDPLVPFNIRQKIQEQQYEIRRVSGLDPVIPW